MVIENTAKMKISGILEFEDGEFLIVGDIKNADSGNITMEKFSLLNIIQDYDRLEISLNVSTKDEFLKLKQTKRASIKGVLVGDKVQVELKEEMAEVSFEEIFSDFIGAVVDINITHKSELD